MSTYRADPVDYERRLRAKLLPESIRATLGFAGIYQMTYEMLKWAVLDKVRAFYSFTNFSIDGEISLSPEEQERYRDRVLSLDRNRFRASLLWLVSNNAITEVEADRLDAVYEHRHSIAHELVKFIIDPDANPDSDLLVDALAILKRLHRFWVDVELASGGFFLPDGTVVEDIDPEEVMPLALVVLQQCMDAYIGGLDDLLNNRDRAD